MKINNNLEKMYDARLEKQLNKLYRFDEGIMSLKQFFERVNPVYKKIFIDEYSSKKIHYEYIKLKNPKKTYGIFYNESMFIVVSKMVYDYYSEVEERK